MSNPSKRKGTQAESKVREYLKENGFPEAERRTLSGSQDKGDLINVPFTGEIKAQKTMVFGAWLDEAVREAKNSGIQPPVVIAKRKGKGDVAEWFWVMRVEDGLKLLKEARGID